VTARRINRNLLVRAIHSHQPVSRADITRLTGLRPSTVSIIAGELIDSGLVVSGSTVQLPRGRWPTHVSLNDMHVTLALDLRPGFANLAIVDINGKILQRDTVDYELLPSATADETLITLAQVVKAGKALSTLYSNRIFDGVGVSVSGRVGRKTHRLLFSPNVPWSRIDLHAELLRVFDAPVEVENAANACLYSEQWFGNCTSVSNILAVSVTEGIGVGMLLDGHVARGNDDMAGEFGHMPLDAAGPLCGCGNTGCWEVFASNRAGLRYYQELVPASTLSSFRELLGLAQAGDMCALHSIDKMATYLARGLTMLVAGLSPEVIVVVGECTALWERISPRIECELIAKSFMPRIPRVMTAADGDAARLRGAAALVLHNVLFGGNDSSFEILRDELDPMPRQRGCVADRCGNGIQG
jgi:predicted NBD/HSP70 family sugar kinase